MLRAHAIALLFICWNRRENPALASSSARLSAPTPPFAYGNRPAFPFRAVPPCMSRVFYHYTTNSGNIQLFGDKLSESFINLPPSSPPRRLVPASMENANERTADCFRGALGLSYLFVLDRLFPFWYHTYTRHTTTNGRRLRPLFRGLLFGIAPESRIRG